MSPPGGVPISLHAHEASASGDSRTSIDAMAARYRQAGFGTVGFVGHDATPETPNRAALPVVVGIEHELRTEPRRLHVVEYPQFGFRFLAHPNLTWPENTRENAADYVASHDVDAVERWNRGIQQYEGHISGVAELANDDAHNPHQIGDSHMVFPTGVLRDSQGLSLHRVFDALRRGEFWAVNRARNPARYAAGRLRQVYSLTRAEI